MKKVVVYYSLQGNTKIVAELIAKKAEADLVQIKPIKDYNLISSATLGKVHINKKHTPEIEPINIDFNDYDEIILGTPVWWYTFVPHVRTFITEHNLSGKNIRLFCTHGGSIGKTFEHLKEAIGEANYIGEKDFFSVKRKLEIIKSEIEAWV